MINSLIKHFFILLIKLYKALLSGFLPDACRFTPSCSGFAIGALEKHGIIKGGWLALKRISKCRPFNKTTGFDPVP